MDDIQSIPKNELGTVFTREIKLKLGKYKMHKVCRKEVKCMYRAFNDLALSKRRLFGHDYLPRRKLSFPTSTQKTICGICVCVCGMECNGMMTYCGRYTVGQKVVVF